VSDLKPDRQRRDLYKSNLPANSRKIGPVLISMFQVFQAFWMYVVFVLYGCCKSRSADIAHVAYVAIVSEACCKRVSVLEVCFIRVFWTHVACVFIWMVHMFHTYVACVLFRCLRMLQWFSSVSEASFKCFNCLQMYVATVVFRYFKSRSVLHLSSPPSAASSLPAPAGHHTAPRPGPSEPEAPRTLALLSLGRCGPGSRVEHKTECSARTSRR
jgi:hypothetical protein